MRLPTVSSYRSQMEHLSKHYEFISKLQSQIASGKKLRHTSEDPVAGEKIKSVSNFIDRIQSYSNNINLAHSRTAVMDSNIGRAIDRAARAIDLVQHARNDTLTDANRLNISAELKSILGEMLNIANLQDTNGEYLFSGFNVNLPAFSKNGIDYQYQGSSEGSQIDIGDGVRVLYSDSGQRVFGQMKSGDGNYSVSSDKDNNMGSGVLNGVELLSHATELESYTISMVTNSDGKLALEVIGSNSGQLIPEPPLVSPADAPLFQAGEPIMFNGLKTEITGQPVDGDQFFIEPSHSQNIFETLEKIIGALEISSSSEKSKADFHQVISEEFSSLQGAFNHLVLMQTETGNRARLIDNQVDVNERLIFDQQALLSQQRDTDLSQAVSDLSQQLSILEISQQSYLKIQNTLAHLLTR